MENLKSKFDELFKTLEVSLDELAHLEKRSTELQQYERELTDREVELNNRENGLKNRENDLEADLKTSIEFKTELAAKEKTIARSEKTISEAKGKLALMDERLKQIHEAELLLEKKEEAIKKQTDDLAREIGSDRKRKEVLDLREIRIKRREQQLQLETEI